MGNGIKAYKLKDIAKIERAKKGKQYPAGSVLVQASAAKGEMLNLDKAGEVDAKYAVVTCDKVQPGYLYLAMSRAWPEYYYATAQGINYPPEELGKMVVPIHEDQEKQLHCIQLAQTVDKWIEEEEAALRLCQDRKKWFLGNMFV